MVAINTIPLFPAIIALSSLLAVTSQDEHISNRHLLTQISEAKLKVSRLESHLDEIIQKNKAKDLCLQTQEDQILEMEKKINSLQSSLSNLKSGSLLIDEKINVLEQEVRELWATSRKNNFDIHVLQSQAQEAEDRSQFVHLQVDKMADIVSEQWIQIQQFEQALLLRQMAVLKAQRQVRPPRCSFLKFINDLCSKYLPKSFGPLDSNDYFRSCMSQVRNQLGRLYSTLKEFHYELQRLIKREMERHEFTAYFAHQELIFFVASALIIFPVFSAWMLLSSQLQ